MESGFESLLPSQLPVDEVDETSDLIRRRPRKYAVAKVENVSRAALRLLEHAADSSFEQLGRRKERQGIEIPLNRDVVSDLRPGASELDPPVDADDVRTRTPELSEQSTHRRSKVDSRYARFGKSL